MEDSEPTIDLSLATTEQLIAELFSRSIAALVSLEVAAPQPGNSASMNIAQTVIKHRARGTMTQLVGLAQFADEWVQDVVRSRVPCDEEGNELGED